ncbi:transcription termination factor MTEF18, mitochondrial-like, partial [Henckelia pumila]|uniref:transcription termination factor MTEF18, mitochondrial-like n=1 Tax=Henckelia pumila TaxID=405737 RepID=UPI003C6DFCB8
SFGLQFDSACALAGIGFPWCKLGLLCREECLILDFDQCILKRRFYEIKDGYGLSSVNVIGICLVWPRVLCGEMDDLLKDMKIVNYGLAGSVEDTVDAMLEVCNKLRVIYDLGCEFGKVGELIGKSKRVLVDYSEEALVRKIEYFCKLNVRKDEIGLFLLSRSEIFGFDMEKRVISVKGFLEHFGFRGKDLISLEPKYPHVFGRNKIENLPNVMRSLDLGEWFFEKMKNGDHSLFSTYAFCHSEEGLDEIYENNLIEIQAKRTHSHSMGKLNFLHSIGFGENKFAVKALVQLNSSGSQLQQRFDYLLNCGIEYSNLCAMVKRANILNQQETALKQKLDFLCRNMGSSFQYLDVFSRYLCYHLEKRIRPRYEFHKWLVEEGFCEKEYSISTIVATSEKTFNARISRICSESFSRAH